MKKKRIVSCLLAAAMVLGVAPLSGVAATVQAAAPAEGNTGEDAAVHTARAQDSVLYFVDCGDPNPATVTGTTDQFGRYNSVTDQHYGVDAKAGYSWGLVSVDETKDIILEGDYVETTHQKINSSSWLNREDGQEKTATFRYADSQDSESVNISPRKIAYQFEVDPGTYDVTVCMSNTWNNAANPTVNLSAAGVNTVTQDYAVAYGGNEIHTATIDLTEADTNENERVELSVMATSDDPTIQMNYIVIREHDSQAYVEPSDPAIAYVGRWDKTDPNAYNSYWAGAYFKVNFTGETIVLDLGKTTTVEVRLDQQDPVTYWNIRGELELTAEPSETGVHTLQVNARFDNDEIQLKGLRLEQGASVSAPAMQEVIEFVGDSITSGYGNPNGASDSYAWRTAELMGYEHVQISYSSIAVTDGYQNPHGIGMLTQYSKLQPTYYTNAADWNFTDYTPKAVVVNLGTNDNTYGVPSGDFQNNYISLLQLIREKNPNAKIFAVIPFGGYKNSEITAAVASVQETDEAVYLVDTTGWLDPATDYADWVHPNVDGQKKVAEKLSAVLSQQLSDEESEDTNDAYVSAGIYSAGRNEDGKAVFHFNMNQAKGVAAVEVTVVASSSDITIEGANGFQYLNVDTVELADGSFEKTVTFSYLPDGAGNGTGVNFQCDQSTTIATFAVGGTAPEIRITSRVIAGYDAENNGVYIDDQFVVIDPDHAIYASYDVNGDGMVNLLDIVTAQKYYQVTDSDSNWSSAASSDVTGDGKINMQDLVAILMNYTSLAA